MTEYQSQKRKNVTLLLELDTKIGVNEKLEETRYQRNEKTLFLDDLTSHKNTTDQEEKALLNQQQIDFQTIIHQPNYPKGKLKVSCAEELTSLSLLIVGT